MVVAHQTNSELFSFETRQAFKRVELDDFWATSDVERGFPRR